MRFCLARIVGFGLLALASGLAQAQAPAESNAKPSLIEIKAQPVFEGSFRLSQLLPVKVTITNNGPSTSAEIQIVGNSIPTKYPVQLPQGSTKEFIANAVVTGRYLYAPMVTINSGIGTFTKPFEVPTGDEITKSFLVIGANSGGLNYLEKNESEEVAYCKPEFAPKRASAYTGFDMILLREGAELLDSDQIEALQAYAARGGVVSMAGSSAQPILENDNFSEFFQVEDRKPVPVDPKLVSSNAKITAYPYTNGLTKNEPVSRAFGYGSTLYYPIDIAQSQMSESQVKDWRNYYKGAFQKSIDARKAAPSSIQLPEDDAKDSEQLRWQRSREEQENKMDIDVRPPNAQNIFGLLFGFIILVAPVNFFILKKLKKGELMWYTAPVLALLTSATLFGMNTGLYKKSEQVYSELQIYLPVNSKVGFFQSKYQFFFPSPGSYVFANNLTNESMVPNNGSNVGFRRQEQKYSMNLFDSPVGLLPQINSGSLGFHQIRGTGKFTGIVVNGEENIAKGVYKINVDGLDTIASAKLSLNGLKQVTLNPKTKNFEILRKQINELTQGKINKGEKATIMLQLIGTASKIAPNINGRLIAGENQITVYSFFEVTAQ